MKLINFTKITTLLISSILVVSCANMQAMMDGGLTTESEDSKEITVDQKLQVSIPIPENSKYLVNKTVIFGEGSNFTGVLYLEHDDSADNIVNFYRKNLMSDGWSEIGIVRSNFILINFDKEDRFATIKVIRKMFDKSDSEITIGPKSSSRLEKSLEGDSNSDIDEPFIVQ